MNLDRFLQEREPSWSELRGLVADAKGRAARLGPARLRRLGALYRSTAADLALARRRFPDDPVVADLAELVGRARHLVYSAGARRESAVDFMRRGYWQRLRSRPVLLLVSALLLFVPLGLATAWGLSDPAAAGSVVPGQLGGVTDRRPRGTDLGLSPATKASLSAQIFTNNIRVALAAFAGGISGGLLTAAALVFNGVVIGAITGLAVEAGNAGDFVQLVVPHGVLELSCIVVAGAAGLRLGWAVVAPGRRARAEAIVTEARAAVEMALGTVPWLVAAGLVEGFVTPSGIGVGPALAVGFALGALYWYLAWRQGRPATGAAVATVAPGLRAGPATSS